MKKSFIQTLTVVVTLLFSFTAFAINGNPNEEKVEAATDSLRKEVTQMVSHADLWGNGIEEEEVIVKFTVNAKGEVQLKNVVTQSEYLKAFVNDNVDNKKVNVNGVATETSYYLKINFKAL